ncbi:hypothetical protein SAY86_016333 [Trapa natans]|uniref:Uncharacterized protein n=1 Tax=Trapa natans TaxID=22666 RepID=A0AAN7LA62_TRANT|nr:hypothetical protein SAY86_016333 [Trapa natans]
MLQPPPAACQLPPDGGQEEDSHMARKLWLEYGGGVNFALLSPFMLCLAGRELSAHDFANFISDHIGFLKSWSFMCQKAADEEEDDEERQALLYQLSGDLAEAWITNESVLQDLVQNYGVDPAILLEETVKFPELKDFPKDFQFGALASTAASLRIFTFLADQVKSVLDPNGRNDDDYPFKNWIQNYTAGGTIKEISQKTEDSLDRLPAESMTNDQIHIMEYQYCIRIWQPVYFLTQNFDNLHESSAAPLIRSPSEEFRIIFFSNFDMSCTSVDSSHVLVESAIEKSAGQQCNNVSAAKLRERWKKIKEEYRIGYQKHVRNIQESQKVKGFNYRYVEETIQVLSEFQKEANLDEVIKSQLLQGLNFREVRRVGEEAMTLNPGCLKFFRSLLGTERVEVGVNVVSCCWSADVIASSFPKDVSDGMNIGANELLYDGQDPDVGEVVGMKRQVESPGGQGEAVPRHPEEHSRQREEQDGADIGIVFANCSSSLRTIASKLKISLVPLFPGLVQKQKEQGHSHGGYFSNQEKGILYTVSNWTEIHAFIMSDEGQFQWCHQLSFERESMEMLASFKEEEEKRRYKEMDIDKTV